MTLTTHLHIELRLMTQADVTSTRMSLYKHRDSMFLGSILKLNQQDATLYNFRLLLSALYIFRAGFPLIIRSSKTVHAASGTCQTCLLWPLAGASRSVYAHAVHSTHAPQVTLCSHNTDNICTTSIYPHWTECVILAKYWLWLPDDGFIVNRNMLEQPP
jgi:hypothetical protein